MSTSEGKCVLVEVGALISWCIYSYRIVMLLVPYMWASMTFLPDDSSENILDKSCGEDASDENFPVRRMKRFAGKKGVELPKKFEGESGREREKTCRKYISSEDVQRLKGSCKDCIVNVQVRCEEKLRTDKL